LYGRTIVRLLQNSGGGKYPGFNKILQEKTHGLKRKYNWLYYVIFIFNIMYRYQDKKLYKKPISMFVYFVFCVLFWVFHVVTAVLIMTSIFVMVPYNLPLSSWSTKVYVYKSKRKNHIFKLLSDRCNQSLEEIMSANNVLFFFLLILDKIVGPAKKYEETYTWSSTLVTVLLKLKRINDIKNK